LPGCLEPKWQRLPFVCAAVQRKGLPFTYRIGSFYIHTNMNIQGRVGSPSGRGTCTSANLREGCLDIHEYSGKGSVPFAIYPPPSPPHTHTPHTHTTSTIAQSPFETFAHASTPPPYRPSVWRCGECVCVCVWWGGEGEAIFKKATMCFCFLAFGARCNEVLLACYLCACVYTGVLLFPGNVCL